MRNQAEKTRKGMRGFGKGLQKAIMRWYSEMEPKKLALQVCKYQSRRVEGETPWSHRDLLRLTHIKANDELHNLVYKYVAKGREAFSDTEWAALKETDLKYIWAHEEAKHLSKEKDLVKLIKDFRLTHESIPSEMKDSKAVYDVLVDHMPVTATLRNLGTMTKVGTIKVLGEKTKIVCDRLTDVEELKRGRVHPVSVLAALKTYAQGHGFKGTNTWSPVQSVNDALNDAFYASFNAIEPTGKRFLLGVDVSGSMGSSITALPLMSCAEGSAVMAMAIARVEKNSHIMGFSHTFIDLKISAKDTLQNAMKKVRDSNFGGTDCALPMVWAQQNKIDVDCFVVITDSETWAGRGHPFEALKSYRKSSGIHNAKMVVIGMTSSGFTIADPSDSGMLDVVGFDTNTPNIISEFVRGTL